MERRGTPNAGWHQQLLFLGVCVAAVFTWSCSSSTPVGVYRLPVPGGENGVELRTFVVSSEPRTLVLYDVWDAAEYGRGLASAGWGIQTPPHHFDVPASNPMILIHRDGILEDVAERPYRHLPVPALSEEVNSIFRVQLSSESELREFRVIEGHLIANRAEKQVEDASIPDPLVVLNSVSGQGLTLPPIEGEAEWKDAVAQAILYDPKVPVPCGAPLTSIYRSRPEFVAVPAGEFEALRITEIIDACRKDDPAEVHVYRVDRWFVPGLGPVRMEFESGSGGVRHYLLLESQIHQPSQQPDKRYPRATLWPMNEGNSWTFELRDEHGNLQDPTTLNVDWVEQLVLP